MNRKLAVASAATAGIAVIALSACSPHHTPGAHHVTVGSVGVAGGAVPVADCAVSVARKHITAYVDFHGTVDGLTAGSQCHELTRLSTRQSYVTATQVTAIPASFKSVCAATSQKGYTATVYSDNPLGDAAGKQFCKAFSRK